jgi:hypothetical protein
MTISEINKTILKKLIADCNSDADIEVLAENLVKKLVLINTDEIDWSMLREQKEYLVTFTQHWESEQMDGIIHFIDFIQDEASTVLGEEVVFGRTPEPNI